MTLFESDPQYREKATIWRVFSLLPLFGPLAGGRVWRWFAINIPMDLGTSGSFTSEIDILARLYDFPRSQEWIYRTWEVKASLLRKDGTARSLKIGKTDRTVTQLRAYRDFGSPDVSLLDIYVCEAGFMSNHPFPPPTLNKTLLTKVSALSREGFGYQLLPFEHDKDGDTDVGLRAITIGGNLLQTTFNILPAVTSQPRQPFSRLADHISDFFERSPERPRKHLNQIVFCRDCHALQLISMRDEYSCPSCGSDLIAQS